MFKLYVVFILVAEIAALALLPLIAPDILVLLLAPIIPLTLVAAFVLYSRQGGLSYEVRNISPQQITSYAHHHPPVVSPEDLSRTIVERTTEIRRTLLSAPSEIQIEMCTLGYRTCVNDMITLTHLANEELPTANFFRRLMLRRARRRATEALATTREALPPGALRATRQEHQ